MIWALVRPCFLEDQIFLIGPAPRVLNLWGGQIGRACPFLVPWIALFQSLLSAQGWILFPVFSFVVIVLSIEGYPTSVWNWCKKTVTKTEAEKSTKPFSSAALKFCLWPWSGQCRSYSKFYCNLEHKNLQTEAVWSIKFSFRN